MRKSTGAPADMASIAKRVDPALVDINTDLSYDQARAAGTGIVLTSNGEVLTNNHVIEGATQIRVTDVGNGRTYAARVVGYDVSRDIAVLRLRGASGLQKATLGDSSNLTVGQPVVGIGNAGGVGGKPSVAGGAVTGLGRTIIAQDSSGASSERLMGMIRTNAPIEPGDSGGALVNPRGQVLGVDTAALNNYSAASHRSEGFAIPIDKATSVVNMIDAGGSSSTIHVGRTAIIGVLVSRTGAQNAQGQPAENVPGVPVYRVEQGKPAQRAGLVAGDVITSINGKAVVSPSGLISTMVRFHPGDRVVVGWVDPNGNSHSATVDLIPGPPS